MVFRQRRDDTGQREWLPALKGYTLAGEYDIEVCLPPEEGSQDMKAYIWIPLKKA